MNLIHLLIATLAIIVVPAVNCQQGIDEHQDPTKARKLPQTTRNNESTQVISCGSCCFQIENVNSYSEDLPPFYQKFINVNGFIVASSSNTSDAALYEAALTVAKMTKNRSDLLSTLVKERVHLAVIGKDELLTDIPQYSSLESMDYARGLAATESIPVTSCAEENLLCLSDDSYSGENICVHEFAHTLQGSGGKLPNPRYVEKGGTENLDDALRTQYTASVVTNGLWDSTYAKTNYEEFWAQGVQSYYNVQFDGVHNSINTRSELQAYDSGLSTLISRVFPSGVTFTCPASTCDCSSYQCPNKVASPAATIVSAIDSSAAPTKAPMIKVMCGLLLLLPIILT